MRIGLNATCFNDRPSGARQRFAGLYASVIRQCPDDEFIVYEPRDCAIADIFEAAPNVIARKTPIPSEGRLRRIVAGRAYWRSAVADDKLDIIENFHIPAPSLSGCKSLNTVHDVRHLLDDQPFWKRLAVMPILRHALTSANAIITVSDTMKRELQAIAPRANVVTVYNGVDAARFKHSDESERGCSLLAVGHLEERKNYLRLIDAFAIVHKARPECRLVIVGRDGGQRSEVADAIRRQGLERAVSLREDVGDDELTSLYRSSSMLVFPSTYEGFGIPILEAMAAGLPMAVSDIPVFNELTEGRVARFRPDDAANMAGTILALLSDKAAQDAMVRYGHCRVEDFAFDRLAQQVVAIYHSVVAETPSPSLARRS